MEEKKLFLSQKKEQQNSFYFQYVKPLKIPKKQAILKNTH